MLRLNLLFALAASAPVAAFGLTNGDGYLQTNLVANKAEYNPQIVDARMINAWGIALRPPGAGGHIWISNAGTGTSSEYIGDVPGNPLHQDALKVVTLDLPRFTDHGYAFVTGQAYNSASDFPGQAEEFHISGEAFNRKTAVPDPIKDGYSGAAKFVFVTEDGCINAWSSSTAVAMSSAPLMVDYSKTAPRLPNAANCVFTGVALTNNASNTAAYAKAGGNHLFAADIRNNIIRVFDNKWRDVTDTHPFQTPPSVGHLRPFNILDLNGHLFVAYAEFDPASDEGQEQILGGGLGHIVEYNEDGTLAMDFRTRGILDAPWGMAIAPAGFGEHADRLLVASFGDGTISAFDLSSGEFCGYLRTPDSKIVSIDGIWAIAFGNGHSLGDSNALYFTAGPNGEEDGIFGRLNAVGRRLPRS